MYKEQLDELYYLLREVFNEGNRQQTTEITDVVYGLAGHLLAGKDYLRLIQYSRYYGEKHLLQPTYEAILEKGWNPQRFVDLGAGLGWLSRGLASRFRIKDVLTVDKRPWMAIDVLADLELGSGLKKVGDQLKDGDVIVASDFLHCIEDPENILRAYPAYPMAILEYMPANKLWATNYREQIKRYGGNPIEPEALTGMLTSTPRKTDVEDLDPYLLILIDREEQCQIYRE